MQQQHANTESDVICFRELIVQAYFSGWKYIICSQAEIRTNEFRDVMKGSVVKSNNWNRGSIKFCLIP